MTAPKPDNIREDLCGREGQNPYCAVCKPGQERQEMFDLGNYKQRLMYQIIWFSKVFNYTCALIKYKLFKILQCDFRIFCMNTVSHGVNAPTTWISNPPIVSKWKNLQNHCVQILMFVTAVLKKLSVFEMRTYLRHEGLGNQISLFCLFGLVQVLVSSSNVHVCTNVVCGQNKCTF